MNKVVLLNPRIAAEDVEIITWRHQTMKRMENEYRAISAEERQKRRREREKAERKRNRVMAKVFTVIMACLVGVYLGRGDLLSSCACIIMALLGCTVIAANGEFDET